MSSVSALLPNHSVPMPACPISEQMLSSAVYVRSGIHVFVYVSEYGNLPAECGKKFTTYARVSSLRPIVGYLAYIFTPMAW